MIRILLCGISGRMGQAIVKLASDAGSGVTVAYGVDKNVLGTPVIPCFTNIDDAPDDFDCIVDFSHHSAAAPICAYARAHNIPAVIASTGHTEDELALIGETSKFVPIFHSGNMSIGVALLCELAARTAAVMANADIEIIETHHRNKLDAPSGTALLIAGKIKAARDGLYEIFGRHGMSKREKDEIGVHAVRRGSVIGIHEVIVSNEYESITLKHEAHDRALFAGGAIVAAKFLNGKEKGMYEIADILNEGRK